MEPKMLCAKTTFLHTGEHWSFLYIYFLQQPLRQTVFDSLIYLAHRRKKIQPLMHVSNCYIMFSYVQPPPPTLVV